MSSAALLKLNARAAAILQQIPLESDARLTLVQSFVARGKLKEIRQCKGSHCGGAAPCRTSRTLVPDPDDQVRDAGWEANSAYLPNRLPSVEEAKFPGSVLYPTKKRRIELRHPYQYHGNVRMFVNAQISEA